MDSLYILIPIALVFCFIAIKLLLWAIDSGQYDDLDKEASRILMEGHDLRLAERHDEGPDALPGAAPEEKQSLD